MGFPRAALFDLDGTLLDSAPDMLATVNAMRAGRGRPPMLLADIRPHVSKGARAMIGAAFDDVDPAVRETWIPEFLARYRDELGRHGAPFDGVEDLLHALEAAGVPWGIVTNKPEALAALLMPMLGWDTRCAVLLGGDSLPARKPDPMQLLVAAEQGHLVVMNEQKQTASPDEMRQAFEQGLPAALLRLANHAMLIG